VATRAAALDVDYVEIEERHSIDPGAWTALRKLAKSRAIDLVHAHEYKTNFWAWLLWQTDGIVPLSTAHGWTGHSRRERLMYYPADKRLLTRFPRLVAVSSEIRRELERHGTRPNRVTTILNGIDHRVFRRTLADVPRARAAYGIRPGEIVIGAVGRLEPQKRFDLLLEAFALLTPDWPNLRLSIVGDGSQRADLERRARDLGLGTRCVFTGHTEDIIGAHHGFDLFVQSSDYEGTPNAVLEAMALETPTVATDVGGTAELVENGRHGVIVPPGDAGRLARAVGGALSDSAGSKRMASAARRRVERELSFDRRMQRLEAIYEDMAAAHRRSPWVLESAS
jgi:glycosyltransferase involved in cell wall biosynthesis